LTLSQSIRTQQVTLLKSGNDTIAVLPLKAIRNINSQLKEARVIKAESIVLKKKLVYSNITLQEKESIILKQQREIVLKDSIINIQSIKIKRQGWDWLRAENKYEREKKKVIKFKRFFIGSLVLSTGIITLILIK